MHGMCWTFSIHLPRKSFLLVSSGSFCELILSCFDFSGISTCHEENIVEANCMYACDSIDNEVVRSSPLTRFNYTAKVQVVAKVLVCTSNQSDW